MDWHVITGEYPPSIGGVGAYCRAVAHGLAAAGERVHVWCASAPEDELDPAGSGVRVHAIAGRWGSADLQRLDAHLEATPAPRRLFVQWVPHAYGRRSLNVGFCAWVRRRARAGDRVELMVHEPFLAFREGSLRQDGAALIHRAMVAMLLRSAARVWVAIPAWADALRPWTFRKSVPFCWLPIPSTVPVAKCAERVAEIKAQSLNGSVECIIGHLGTYSDYMREDLRTLLPRVLREAPGACVHLLGRGSSEFLRDVRPILATDASRVTAWGELPEHDLSCHLQACDLMMLPYRDGASTRRTTLMAALAHGMPVVTSVGRLSEEFWKESRAVSVVPAADLDAMAERVTALARQPALRQQFRAAATVLYEDRFSLPRVLHTLRADACHTV